MKENTETKARRRKIMANIGKSPENTQNWKCLTYGITTHQRVNRGKKWYRSNISRHNDWEFSKIDIGRKILFSRSTTTQRRIIGNKTPLCTLLEKTEKNSKSRGKNEATLPLEE